MVHHYSIPRQSNSDVVCYRLIIESARLEQSLKNQSLPALFFRHFPKNKTYEQFIRRYSRKMPRTLYAIHIFSDGSE